MYVRSNYFFFEKNPWNNKKSFHILMYVKHFKDWFTSKNENIFETPSPVYKGSGVFSSGRKCRAAGKISLNWNTQLWWVEFDRLNILIFYDKWQHKMSISFICNKLSIMYLFLLFQNPWFFAQHFGHLTANKHFFKG